MIKVERVAITGNMPFEDVQLYLDDEIDTTNYFEGSQIVMKCKHGKFTLPMYKIMHILYRRSKKIKPALTEKVKRLSIAGDMTFAPAYLLHPDKLEEAGIPQIFKPLDQFTFAADEGIYITTDFNVTLIEH